MEGPILLTASQQKLAALMTKIRPHLALFPDERCDMLFSAILGVYREVEKSRKPDEDFHSMTLEQLASLADQKKDQTKSKSKDERQQPSAGLLLFKRFCSRPNVGACLTFFFWFFFL